MTETKFSMRSIGFIAALAVTIHAFLPGGLLAESKAQQQTGADVAAARMAATGFFLEIPAAMSLTGNREDLVRIDPEGQAHIVLEESDEASFSFVLEQDSAVQLYMEYLPMPGIGLDPEISIQVDGEHPGGRSDRVFLHRTWQDAPDAYTPDGRFRRDNRGYELVPRQIEQTTWITEGIREQDSLLDSALPLDLAEGPHVLTVRMERESIAIRRMILIGEDTTLPDYNAYREAWPRGETSFVPLHRIEAEKVTSRSHPMILPVFDRSTPSTEPNDPARIVLNAIGGYNWRLPGHSLTWQVDVEKTGWYSLVFKYRQDLVRGLPTRRRLLIDGTVPFQEAAVVSFPFNDRWQNLVLGESGQEPYEIYLDEGLHNLTLEVVLGELGPVLEILEEAVGDLNRLYRRIVMITGTIPDPNRDYYLERDIPDLYEILTEKAILLRTIASDLERDNGRPGGETAFLLEMARQMDSLVREPETIPERLDRLRNNIGELANLILRLKEQPLQLDAIYLSDPAGKVDPPDTGIFRRIYFRLQVFLYSFFENYAALGNLYRPDDTIRPLEVWVSVNDLAMTGVSSGRDQAEVLKRLVDESFVPSTGIPVNLSLVNTSDTLLQAIIGGTGPDAALFVPKSMPVNLAMRGALADFSRMDGFDTIRERFKEAAFVPYQFRDGMYAIPETQSWNMLFVRKDLFEEFGLSVPDTWEAFLDVTARLQKKNLQVGIPESQTIFEMLLLQNGASLYSENLSATALNTPSAIDAFTAWTDFYIQYSLPLAFDFFNRFRTGEMPMGITSYSFYNQLSIAAPEIRNAWEMQPVPGIPGPNGIDRSQTGSGSGCILTSRSRQPGTAYAFLDWWTSEEIQRRFGREMEVILGSAARYNTANVLAFSQLPWSAQERAVLTEQWNDVRDFRQTPAAYYISRNISNAFRRAVYFHENPREILNKYSRDMDLELKRKWEEFGSPILEGSEGG